MFPYLEGQYVPHLYFRFVFVSGVFARRSRVTTALLCYVARVCTYARAKRESVFFRRLVKDGRSGFV